MMHEMMGGDVMWSTGLLGLGILVLVILGVLMVGGLFAGQREGIGPQSGIIKPALWVLTMLAAGYVLLSLVHLSQ